MASAVSACRATKLVSYLRGRLTYRSFLLIPSSSCLTERTFASSDTSTISKNSSKKKKVKEISTKLQKLQVKAAAKYSPALVKEKRRTRSDKEFDEDAIRRYAVVGRDGDGASHIPVMLAEVLDVFSSSYWRPLHSFVDCTLGAAGHSSAIIQAHPELKLYVGMDVDHVAHAKAQATLDAILGGDNCNPNSNFKAHTVVKNFRFIKSVLNDIDSEPSALVDGILMDLGMSSMQVDDPKRGFSVLGKGPLDMRMDPQATLKAEDILNLWPDAEVGRILREYGEESNWRLLQKEISKARLNGGLHSTSDLVNLIQNSTPKMRGGRQGWIKTATRVFQALRIAVNDELKRLEDSLYNCFDCLAPGGRLAVISFHSLEDRIVKQTFLKIFNDEDVGDVNEGERERFDYEEAAWIRQTIHGSRGTILTKRPITPSEKEERLNRRSRSAKLRVIQKG